MKLNFSELWRGIKQAFGELRARVLPGASVGGSLPLLGDSSESASGVDVSPDGALASPVVLACVQVHTNTLCQMPLHLIRKKTTGQRRTDPAVDLELYHLLHRQPNEWMTAFEFIEWIHASVLLRGNGYAEIVRNRFGDPIALWPLFAHRTWFENKGGKLVYFTVADGKQFSLQQDQVLHLKGFSPHGLVGWALLNLCKDAVGLQRAQEIYQGKFYKNNVRPTGYLKLQGTLKDDALERLRKNIEIVYGGLDNSHRIAIFEEGMEWEQTGLSPEDAEVINSRTFQVAEIARIFRIPLHMIQELTRATFSNIEQQALEFVKYSIAPWVSRWEQRLDMSLLGQRWGEDLFFKFSMEGLLRADSKGRSEYYHRMFGMGALNIDEIRDLEDWNPLPDGLGKNHFVPLNLVPVSRLDEIDYSKSAGNGDKDKDKGDTDTDIEDEPSIDGDKDTRGQLYRIARFKDGNFEDGGNGHEAQ